MIPLDIVAFHEAGHAVAALVLRIRVDKVSGVASKGRRKNEETSGHCNIAAPWPRQGQGVGAPIDYAKCTPEQCRDVAIYHLAGGEAERMLREKRYPDQLRVSAEGHEDVIVAHRAAVEWRRQLEGTIPPGNSGDDVLQFRCKAREMILEHWSAVEAVANALIGKTITGAEARNLFEAATSS
ncbi:hypothetical protein [Longimicrobium sp.]|jgi:hypothetical protein|uniref:hypothetical protein n=1 Tax=Longimicrobium sp. TaxID=2029185 RepID=UPI002ED8E3A4